MQAKDLAGGQEELICMNVDKVYDWIVNEATFNVGPLDVLTFSFPTGTDITSEDIATVSCEVVPTEDDPFVILSREDRQFIIDGDPVTLQQVSIQKSFDISIIVTLTNGLTVTVDVENPLAVIEQVVICAPVGTTIDVNYTDIDCFITSRGTIEIDGTDITLTGVTLTITACQSIQSTFPVTVEFSAEFCSPRDILPTPCPAPVLPPQCPVLFPNGGNGD